MTDKIPGKKPDGRSKPRNLTFRVTKATPKKRITKMNKEANMTGDDTFDADIAKMKEMELLKAREDRRNQVTMTISRPGDAQTLEIYIKAPVLAEIVRKMVPGNYPQESYDKVYKTFLQNLEPQPGKPKLAEPAFVTRPAVAKITTNFKSGTDFDWDYPRAAMLYNPDKLTEGFTITIKVDKPVAPDTLRKWGKMFMDGCNDIIANARPFKMSWVMDELPQQQAPAPKKVKEADAKEMDDVPF